MSKRFILALSAGLLAGVVQAGPPTMLPPTSGPIAVPTPVTAAPAPVTTPVPAYCGPTDTCWVEECCPQACEPCWACGPDGRVWVSAELLYWAAQGASLPPLVTASPPGTPQTAAGVLGAPGTTTLFGNTRTNNDLEPGFRVTAGAWLNESRTIGIEGSWFFIGENGDKLSFGAADGSSIVSRPFFDAVAGVQSAELVSFPGVVGGTVTVDNSSYVNGAQANALFNVCCSCQGRLDVLAGYRYLGLDDTLEITENLLALGGAGLVTPGTTIVVRDRFRTENEFHGGQVGLAGEVRYGRVFAYGAGKIAFGNTRSETTVSGSTTVTGPGGAPITRPGGLLAQGTNSGRFVTNEFAVVPEATLRLGVQATDRLRVFAGYNFLYWSRVTRPGDQIDPRINVSQLPPGTLVGAPLPVFANRQTDYWLQGISGGVEFRY